MRGIIYIIIVLVTLSSCNQKREIVKKEITKIDVYYIPFGILFPTQSDESSIREIKSYLIKDSLEIENVKNQIKNLVETGSNKFNKNNIYLLCDFYTKDEKAFTLMFDKNFIDINGKTYDENERLINLLINNKPDN
jgi:hypothetical protein